jgi:PmbA protein
VTASLQLRRDPIVDPESALRAADAVVGELSTSDRAEVFFHGDEEVITDVHALDRDFLERRGQATRAAVRIWSGDRCGRAAGTIQTGADLAAVAEAASARLARGKPAPFPCAEGEGGAGAPAGRPSRERGRALAVAVLDALSDLGPRIQTVLVAQYHSWTAVSASGGLRVWEWHAAEQAAARLESGSGAIVDAHATTDPESDWDLGPLRARVAEAAAAFAATPGTVDRKLPVVMRPPVAGPLVEGLAWLLRGSTALSAQGLAAARGRAVFPSHLSVLDVPTHSLEIQRRRIDDEGRATETVALVDRGRLLTFLHSAATAAALNDQPNARAFRLPLTLDIEPRSLNLHIVPVATPLPESYIELTGRKETLSTMPRAGLITIVARGWQVEYGERVCATPEFDLDLPLVPTLRKLIGVADDLTFLPTHGCGTPSLLFPSLQMLLG